MLKKDEEENKDLYKKLSEECQKLPASGKEDLEGLETRGWVPQQFGNPGKAFVLQLKQPEGKKMLGLVFSGGSKDKAGFGRVLDLALKENGKLAFAAFNPQDAPISVSVAFTVSPNHVWYESKPIELKAGWNKAELDLGASDYKCASSKWEFTAALWKKDDVKGLYLVVNNAKRDGYIFVDGVTLDTIAKSDLPPKPPDEKPEKPDEKKSEKQEPKKEEKPKERDVPTDEDYEK